MSLEAFGVKNLRCLTDTGLVPLPPITILVGRNSSGKSTFLRAFPLLRQSVESARGSSGPIRWNYPNYVDFGSLDLAINESAAQRSVTFMFATKWSESEDDIEQCELEMDIAPSASEPYVRSYGLRIGQEKTRLQFDDEHRLLHVDGQPDELIRQRDLCLGGLAYLVASLYERREARLNYQPFDDSPFAGIANARTSWPAEGEGIPRIARALHYMDVDIARFMYGVAYLGPSRAVGGRQYRLDDVAVEEVAADGTNMAKFLASLSEAEMDDFRTFTRKHLAFETAVRVQGVFGEILVKEPGGRTFANVADVGHGYAEVLPLCATLWSNCVREPSPKRRRTSLLALEQPELHLHPAYQARLADIIAGAWRTNRDAGREVKLMVETHSEGLVNRMGELVHDGVLRASDVQILVFNQDADTRQTEVRIAGYTAEGALNDAWPFGFFAPVAD